MKLAGHTLATPELELPAALRLFARLGLEGVEIVQDDDYLCALPEGPTYMQLRDLRRDLDGLGFAAVHITPYVRTLDSLDSGARRDALESLKTAIECAAELGAGGVRVLAGRNEGDRPDERRQAFIDSIRELDDLASSASVSLNIESKGWSFAAGTKSICGLIEEVGCDSVGILFDPGNLVLDGFDALEEFAGQVSRIRHVHVKDLRGLPDGAFETLPLGRGDVPWTDLLPRLMNAGFAGFLSLEYERRWHPELPVADVAYPQQIAFLHAGA